MSNENPTGQTAAPWGDPGSIGDGHPATGSTGKRTSVLGAWGARIVLIVVAACALVSVAFILFGAGGDTLGRVITTDVALVVFALLVWLDTVIGAYRPEWFEFASLATDAYLLLLWIVTIWTENGSGPFVLWVDIWRGILCLIFVRGMLALADLVRLLYSRWVTTVTRVLAFVSAGAFGVIAVMVTIPAPNPFSHLWDYDFYGRIVASLAVIAGVALVLIPLWGLLINRSHRARHPSGYGASAIYPGAFYGSSPYGAGSQGTGYPGAGYPAAGYPAVAAQPGYAPGVAPVPPAPGQQGASGVPAAAAAPAPAGSSVPQPSGAGSAAAAPPAPVGSAPGVQQGAAPVASHPALTWPRLTNGSPVPADSAGAPDFRAVGSAPLAWPTFVDGTPVPAAPDGSPLYR